MEYNNELYVAGTFNAGNGIPDHNISRLGRDDMEKRLKVVRIISNVGIFDSCFI